MGSGFVPDQPVSTAPQSSGFTPDAPTQAPAHGGGFTPDAPKISEEPHIAPKPQATNHDYDQIIRDAARAHGIDPRILQAVGMQESGLGRGLTKQGLSPDPTNAGHGIWQLDPASHASPETLARAAHDPRFAADYAAGMLSNLLKTNHGDVRRALAAYNAGQVGMEAGGGADYAASVQHFMDSIEPLHEIKKQITHVAKRAADLQRAGKSPLHAFTDSGPLHPISQEFKKADSTQWWAQNHPLEALGDVLGIGERAVGTAFEEAQQRGGLINTVRQAVQSPAVRQEIAHRLGENIWHPTDAVRKHLDESESHFSPVNVQNLHNFISHSMWMPAGLRTQLDGLARSQGSQAVVDFINQTMMDPLTYAGGLGLAGHAFGAAGGIARAFYKALKAEPLLHKAGVVTHTPFDHLEHFAQGLEDTRRQLFGVRHDLDEAGFTRRGKQTRLGLENAAVSRSTDRAKRIEQVIHSADESADYLHHIASQLPSDADRIHPRITSRESEEPTRLAKLMQEVSNPATTATRRKEILTQLSSDLTKHEIGTNSARIFGNDSSLYLGNRENLYHLSHEGVNPFASLKGTPVADRLAQLQEYTRHAMFWNPLPHALMNVGTNTFLAGGIPAIAHGIASMVRPLDKADLARLRNMGGLPDYMAGAIKNPLEHLSQNAMEHIEAGWRVGLMKALDASMSKPKNEVEELIRGALINQKVGDYRNQSAFVHLFKALGGPFVAFRLGITPKVVADTLMHHPERIQALLRAQQDTHTEFGGPVEDFMKFATNPRGFLANTGGELTKLGEHQSLSKGDLESVLDLLSNYYGPANIARSVEGTAVDQTAPNMSLADHLAHAIMTIMNSRPAKPESSKAENAGYKEIQRSP